ncbi:arginine/serine-rich coiled-coil protein 2 isoform X2 [Bicyclus anynana]|uniref:Arginine/serine-rich coiled-coil protein 2 isoform X2 n=1 Tax=Bicyclus anynana TaxID=110368 RepID=A0ABM3LJE8_BICAN|nr:arginine/serine-rich coiled-coil protein 2 isoform X2 [Bicyclus anynana]XP_052739201.1 arginine/serine-rich coiled-coil protein 2 isoform X2 [Bicyclus anynana]
MILTLLLFYMLPICKLTQYKSQILRWARAVRPRGVRYCKHESGESEPELPPAAPAPPPARARAAHSRERDRSRSAESRDRRRDKDRDRSRSRSSRDRRSPRRDERRDDRSRDERSGEERSRDERNREERNRDERNRDDRSRDDRSRDERNRDDRSRDERNRDERSRDERSRDERSRAPRRGLLGDRPDDRGALGAAARAHDARDAVSPRFVEQRRDRDRDARAAKRDDDRRSAHERARGAAGPPPAPHHAHHAPAEPAPGADYRPSSYKVNKKLEVMEKMGLQIKTPDGSMATARQLRAATAPAGAQAAYALQSHRALDQVQKRKLLWAGRGADAEAEAARWSGARFAQDSAGKQVSKFMRLMGIKDPAAVRAEAPDAAQDPNRKQEELFQAMQAQYDVARATTHTMRGVGLGFQRGNF